MTIILILSLVAIVVIYLVARWAMISAEDPFRNTMLARDDGYGSKKDVPPPSSSGHN